MPDHPGFKSRVQGAKGDRYNPRIVGYACPPVPVHRIFYGQVPQPQPAMVPSLKSKMAGALPDGTVSHEPSAVFLEEKLRERGESGYQHPGQAWVVGHVKHPQISYLKITLSPCTL